MCNEISKLNIIQSGVIKSEDVEGIVNYIVASGKLTGFNLNIASEGLCLPEFFMFFSTVLQRMSDEIIQHLADLYTNDYEFQKHIDERLNSGEKNYILEGLRELLANYADDEVDADDPLNDIGRMLFNGEASIEEIVSKLLNDLDI